MFETQRLIIRPFKDSDAETIFRMRSDPDVMRFISFTQSTLAEAEQWMEKLSSKFDSEGIGYLALEEKGTGEVVGWCGLWRVPETWEIEVGYGIAKSRWGYGFATEAAREMVAYGFRVLDLEYIVAVAFPENSASINVMKKIGMTYVTTGTFYGKELVQYSIPRERWEEHRDE